MYCDSKDIDTETDEKGHTTRWCSHCGASLTEDEIY